jgi:hypothetical protein
MVGRIDETAVVLPSRRYVSSLTRAGARALIDVLTDTSSVEVRLQAALALADFTQIGTVLSSLTSVSLTRDESIDLRYAAFTSIERPGATPEAIASLREIVRDETMGDAARSVLSAWQVN